MRRWKAVASRGTPQASGDMGGDSASGSTGRDLPPRADAAPGDGGVVGATSSYEALDLLVEATEASSTSTMVGGALCGGVVGTTPNREALGLLAEATEMSSTSTMVRGAPFAARSSAIPPGLTIGRLKSERLCEEALSELRPHFERCGRKQASSSTLFEIGLSFYGIEKHQEVLQTEKLRDFPALHALLAESMSALGDSSDLNEASLNVICRRYRRGEGIPMHYDRKQLFTEDVYGCVLLNTSDGALCFRREGRVDALEEFRIDEQPGVCFLQRGPARYEWSHGVKPISRGERVSVTWRWFSRVLPLEAPAADAGRQRRSR